MHGHSAAWLEISLSVATAVHIFRSPLCTPLQILNYKFYKCTVIFVSVAWFEVLPSAVDVVHIKYKSYMHGHFYFCHLIGNINISSNYRAQFYKFYTQAIFTSVAWLEIFPAAVTFVHNSTNPMYTVICDYVNLYIVNVL